MTSIVVRDATASGASIAERPLDFAGSEITVRDLIRARVIEEVADYNSRGAAMKGSLVTPQPSKGATVIDPEEQVARAFEAFQRNGYFLLLDERQVTSLDEVIHLGEVDTASFIKLVPLVGG
jgi:hypothetical protein